MPVPSGPVPNFANVSVQPASDLNKLSQMIGSTAPGLVAKAGGGKAGATPITGTNARLSTVATANDSAILPKGYAGLEVFVANAGVASAQIFGFGTDTINDVATATGVAQANGVNAIYKCITVTAAGVGQWYRILSA